MYNKLVVIFIIITLALAGCSSGSIPDITEEGDKQGVDEQAATVETMKPDEGVKTEDKKQPVEEDEKTVRTEPVNTESEAASGQAQTTVGPLISKVETVHMFLEAWRNKDLERMDMLTLTPLETFFRNSDILFASYHYLDSGDIAGFVRDGLETLAVYDENALDNIEVESLQTDDGTLLVRLGEAFDMTAILKMDDNIWKIEMIDSLPAEMHKAVPEEWGSLNNSVLADLGDLNDDGSLEILTMGIWGEWEGIGPEPSSAIGIYSCEPQGLSQMFFKDINERLNHDRVVLDGRIGVFDKDGGASILILEKTAVDEIAALKPGEVKYYLSLYSFEGNKLEFLEDIGWSPIALELASGTEKEYEPQWMELLGVHNIMGPSRSDVIVKIGFSAGASGEEVPGIVEGLLILSNRSGEWRTEWSNIGEDGEYHDVVFGVPGGEDAAGVMYYFENGFESEGAGSVYKVYYDGSAWKEEEAVAVKGEIKAASDMDGDGRDEFLVWEGSRLVILSDRGEELWGSGRLTGTKQIPFAWMGASDGTQRVIAGLHQGSFASWKSQVFEWEGKNYSLDRVWQSEELGTQGISAMHVRDIDKDEKPEVLVNFSNDYLTRGQYFKVFEP